MTVAKNLPLLKELRKLGSDDLGSRGPLGARGRAKDGVMSDDLQDRLTRFSKVASF
jgi:hypothetical protein